MSYTDENIQAQDNGYLEMNSRTAVFRRNQLCRTCVELWLARGRVSCECASNKESFIPPRLGSNPV